MTAEQSPTRVMIVDDEPHIVTSLTFLMRQKGFDVQVLNDGAAALAAIREHQPALVLLDVMLPSMDGVSVCSELKSDPATAGIKVVMLTAKGREDDRQRGLAAGADLYVIKPFSTRQLVADVMALLNS